MELEIKVSSILSEILPTINVVSDISHVRQAIISKLFSDNKQDELLNLHSVLSNNDTMQKIIAECIANMNKELSKDLADVSDDDTDSFVNIDGVTNTPQFESVEQPKLDMPQLTLTSNDTKLDVEPENKVNETIVEPTSNTENNTETNKTNKVNEVNEVHETNTKLNVEPESNANNAEIKINANNVEDDNSAFLPKNVSANFAIFETQAKFLQDQVKELCDTIDSKMPAFYISRSELNVRINKLDEQQKHVESIISSMQSKLEDPSNKAIEQVLRSKIEELTVQKAPLINELITMYKWFAHHATLRETLDNQHHYDDPKKSCEYRNTPEFKEAYQILLTQLRTCGKHIMTDSEGKLTFAIVSDDYFKHNFMQPIWDSLKTFLVKCDPLLEQYFDFTEWHSICYRTILSFFDLKYYIMDNINDDNLSDIIIVPQNDSQRYYINTTHCNHGNYFYDVKPGLLQIQSAYVVKKWLNDNKAHITLLNTNSTSNNAHITLLNNTTSNIEYVPTLNRTYYAVIPDRYSWISRTMC